MVKIDFDFFCVLKIFVPLTHDGVKGWIFNLVCPGNALGVFHESLLLLNNATVNRNLGFDDVCTKKVVYIAYNNDPRDFEINSATGEMVKFPVQPIVSYGNIAWEWEIQVAFFESYNIKPEWINANFNWGTLNSTTGQWSGAVGMIQRDEADYAIYGFAGTYARSKVATLSATGYRPLHWLTRYPLKLSPTWNLFGLFTKGHKSQIGNLFLI